MQCKTQIESKEHLKIDYKTLKNEITTLSRQSKKAYYKQYFTENKDNLQKIWNGTKETFLKKENGNKSHTDYLKKLSSRNFCYFWMRSGRSAKYIEHI